MCDALQSCTKLQAETQKSSYVPHNNAKLSAVRHMICVCPHVNNQERGMKKNQISLFIHADRFQVYTVLVSLNGFSANICYCFHWFDGWKL